jgi:hypothetical protein
MRYVVRIKLHELKFVIVTKPLARNTKVPSPWIKGLLYSIKLSENERASHR